VGTGLIGGSLGLALRRRGWHVSGTDRDPEQARQALALGVLDAIGDDPEAEIVFVATPAAIVAQVASRILGDRRRPDVVVTDVSGVKTSVVGAVGHARFVGGHPMAGSEQVGLAGADPGLFDGAVWVLTPTPQTDLGAYAVVQDVVNDLGAEPIALTPADHDRLVAVVSHVPHLVAATLMNAASTGAQHDAALLRLAAGGFRDMTRVAAGHPGIWPDVCTDNAPAIVAALDGLLADLAVMRDRVAGADRSGLLEVLARASSARRSLPARAARPDDLAEIRVPVPDREGVLAEITSVAGDLGVNIYDIEIAHSSEGNRGVLVLVVERPLAGALRDSLGKLGYPGSVGVLA
jgi:prephenate dehydrogenase